MGNTTMNHGSNKSSDSMTRRDVLTVCGLGGLLFGVTGVRELRKRLDLSEKNISIADAINHIPPDTRRAILLEAGSFEERIGQALVVLNSIPDKELNQLFLQGTELANRVKYSFRIDSTSANPFTVNTDRREITISPTWISYAQSINPMIDTITLTLVTTGGALATLLALHHLDPLIIDSRLIAGQGTKIRNTPAGVGHAAIAPQIRAAALIVGVLVAEQMWQMDAGSYFDQWHMLSPVVLERTESIPSRVEEAIDKNEDFVFEGVPFGQRTALRVATAEQVRILMHELEFDQKSIGRRTTS